MPGSTERPRPTRFQESATAFNRMENRNRDLILGKEVVDEIAKVSRGRTQQKKPNQ